MGSMSWWPRLLWIAAVVLVALTAGLTFARLLEMPVELGYDTSMYVRLNDALYPHLSYVSAAVEVLAMLATAALALVERGTKRFRPALSAAVLMAGALVLWLAVVRPANAVFATWAPQSLPPHWHQWRLRWEMGQVGSVVLLSAAFVLLLVALTGPGRLIRTSPEPSPRTR